MANRLLKNKLMKKLVVPEIIALIAIARIKVDKSNTNTRILRCFVHFLTKRQHIRKNAK